MENNGLGNFCGARFSVLGYPDDLAVKNVKGRPGAALGPEKFLEYFFKLKGATRVLDAISEKALVPMGSDLEENYRRSTDLTRKELLGLERLRDALVVVGGGHDYAYPWLSGVRQALPKKLRLGCINLDAHFDLREYKPVMTSGSPFRRLIEERVLEPGRLIEFGIQSHCNAAELWEYSRSQKIETVPMEALRNGRAVREFKRVLQNLKRKSDVVVISLDLDSVSLSYAPGVSAPQPEGFTASELFEMLELAGSDPKVFSLGIFELSPPLDVGDQTSRLAAQAAWKFMQEKMKGRKK